MVCFFSLHQARNLDDVSISRSICNDRLGKSFCNVPVHRSLRPEKSLFDPTGTSRFNFDQHARLVPDRASTSAQGRTWTDSGWNDCGGRGCRSADILIINLSHARMGRNLSINPWLLFRNFRLHGSLLFHWWWIGVWVGLVDFCFLRNGGSVDRSMEF
jgi:hypothetical protein